MLGRMTNNYCALKSSTTSSRRAARGSKAVTMVHRRRSRLLCWTAAAAFSSSAQAWITVSPRLTYSTPFLLPATRDLTVSTTPNSHHYHTHHPPQRQQQQQRITIPASSSTARYYSSKNNHDNDKSDGGILSTVGNALKKVLPKKWFQSEQEQQSALRKQEFQQEMKGGISEMLKDAPLGIRMMGKMISPLVSSMASTLAETVAEQQKTTQTLLNDASGYLAQNDDVLSALGGEPLRVGMPFSQSSSTSNINGQVQSRIELGVPVSGRNGSTGNAFISATEEGITNLIFESPQGRRMNVSLFKVAGGSSSSSSKGRPFKSRSSSGGDNTIIEAEIIDKKTK